MLKHTPLHAVTHSATTQVQVGLQRLFELLIVNYFSISQAAERLTEQLWLIGPAALRPLMLIYFPDIHKVKSAEKKGPRQLSADLCCVFMWGFISISKNTCLTNGATDQVSCIRVVSSATAGGNSHRAAVSGVLEVNRVNAGGATSSRTHSSSCMKSRTSLAAFFVVFDELYVKNITKGLLVID